MNPLAPAGLGFFRPAVEVRSSLAGLGQVAPAATGGTAGSAWSWLGDVAQAVGGVVSSFSPEYTKQKQAEAQAQMAYAQAQMTLARQASASTTTWVVGGVALLAVAVGGLYLLRK